MTANLSHKDWIEISAYLDGKLSNAETARVDERLEANPQFHQAFREIKHTRTLLRSLHPKRAPRNFTLSQEYAKASARHWGMQSFLGLASASTAIVVVALFVGVNFFSKSSNMAALPPQVAALPETALDTSLESSSQALAAPMIITWGRGDQAYGLGGGGNPSSYSAKGDNGGYGGGGPAEVAEPVLLLPAATQSPQATSDEAANADPSTLILGLPEPGTEGQVIERNAAESFPVERVIPVSTLWMIGLGIVSLASGLLALIFRRR